ncbi:MAG: glycosyltransferase [Muribaculaceae bacterium]|jgi:hypothetical protein|nr:glycosyltransferase [Muribaculaceae bacterium]
MKKRVLILSHIPPYPAVGGDHIRICESVSFLARHFCVDIAYISHRHGVPCQKAFNAGIANEYRFYVPTTTRVLQVARTLLNGHPSVVNHYNNRALHKFVESRARDYDFVFCASAVMAQYAMRIEGLRAYLDMTDSLAMNRSTAAEMQHGLRRRLLKEESQRLSAYEAEALAYFRHTAYISEADAAFIAGGNKYIVGNSVQTVDDSQCCRHTAEAHNMLFTGIMDYEPNVTAARFFALEAMPLIRRATPQATFTIAGKSPAAKVRELAALEGIAVTGYVESLTPFYNDCALVVAPMLSGSGIQNKILQAMSRRCCVLTTPKGIEGMEQLDDALVVCDPDAPTMARTAVGLLQNRDERMRIGTLAHSRVADTFGPAQTDTQYCAFFDIINKSGE